MQQIRKLTIDDLQKNINLARTHLNGIFNGVSQQGYQLLFEQNRTGLGGHVGLFMFSSAIKKTSYGYDPISENLFNLTSSDNSTLHSLSFPIFQREDYINNNGIMGTLLLHNGSHFLSQPLLLEHSTFFRNSYHTIFEEIHDRVNAYRPSNVLSWQIPDKD